MVRREGGAYNTRDKGQAKGRPKGRRNKAVRASTGEIPFGGDTFASRSG